MVDTVGVVGVGVVMENRPRLHTTDNSSNTNASLHNPLILYSNFSHNSRKCNKYVPFNLFNSSRSAIYFHNFTQTRINLLFTTNIQNSGAWFVSFPTPKWKPVMRNYMSRVTKKFFKGFSVVQRFKRNWWNVAVRPCRSYEFLLRVHSISHLVTDDLKPRLFLFRHPVRKRTLGSNPNFFRKNVGSFK